MGNRDGEYHLNRPDASVDSPNRCQIIHIHEVKDASLVSEFRRVVKV